MKVETRNFFFYFGTNPVLDLFYRLIGLSFKILGTKQIRSQKRKILKQISGDLKKKKILFCGSFDNKI